ncbi:MAG: aspartyl/asparaginyl beta-hydroxylase domain-containing protein [Rhodothalassiaceae bacterium]
MALPANLPPQARLGFEALQRGDPATAKTELEHALAAQPGDATVQLGLAMACRDLGDQAACGDWLDHLLSVQPRHFMALVMKADNLMALGRRQEAASYYQAVLAVAPPPHRQPPQIQQHVQRAQRLSRELVADYERHLRQALAQRGFATAPDGPGRHSEAVDILFGRRQIFVQQPEQFFYPGLPNIQFYERRRFDWVAPLERHTEAIAAEAAALVQDEAAFQPYLHAHGPRTRDTALHNNIDWSACYLVRDGNTIDANATRCPQTVAALQQVPGFDLPGKGPSVLFSLLRPGARIEPHCGLMNVRLICHLPLIVPDGCTLRVGNETRRWRTGETLIFDDSIEHEAHNPSTQRRIVLLFDIWRPDLGPDDRAFLAALFGAVDAYGAGQVNRQAPS